MSQLLQRKWFGLGFQLKSYKSKSYQGRGSGHDPERKAVEMARNLSAGQFLANETKYFHFNSRFRTQKKNFILLGTMEINRCKGFIIARGVTGIGEKIDHTRTGRIRISGGWIKSDEPRFGVIYGQSSSITNFNPNRNWDIATKQKGMDSRISETDIYKLARSLDPCVRLG